MRIGVPRRGGGRQQKDDKGDEGHAHQGCGEPNELPPIDQPQRQRDSERKYEVTEVDDCRRVRDHPAGRIRQPGLEDNRGQVASEQRLFQAGQVADVRRNAGFRGHTSHRLPGQEDQDEWDPIA